MSKTVKEWNETLKKKSIGQLKVLHEALFDLTDDADFQSEFPQLYTVKMLVGQELSKRGVKYEDV